MIRKNKWEDLITEEWNKELKTQCKKKAKNFGVKLIECELIELTKTDVSMRLYNEPTQTAAIGVTI